MAIGDTYHILVFATFSSQSYMNTFAVQTLLDPTPTASQFQTLANDFKEIWRTQQHGGVLWTTWQARQLWGPNMAIDAPNCRRTGGNILLGNLLTPFAGGIATGDQALPPQSAYVVTLQTGIAGRSKRGRSFGFGFLEGEQSAGLWDSTLSTNLTTSWNTFKGRYMQGGTDPNFRMGVWSERIATGCIPGPGGKGHTIVGTPQPGSAFTPITDYRLRPVVYTQRRRTLGVGR